MRGSIAHFWTLRTRIKQDLLRKCTAGLVFFCFEYAIFISEEIEITNSKFEK